MLLSLVFFTLFNIGVIVCANAAARSPNLYGLIMIPEAKVAIIWLQVSLGSYVATMLVLKISIAIFYLRVMVKSWQRRVICGTLGLVTIFSIAYFFFAILQCGPTVDPIKFMNRKLGGQCVSDAKILGASYAQGAITSVTDIIYAAMPVTLLRRSNMRARDKVTVMFILTLAAFGGIASMIRMNYISRLATATISWFTEANMIAIWSTIEPGLGIIAASLATLRPLVRQIWGTSYRVSTLNGMTWSQPRASTIKSMHTQFGTRPHDEEIKIYGLQYTNQDLGVKDPESIHPYTYRTSKVITFMDSQEEIEMVHQNSREPLVH
ncbi:uncharacterized protein PV09_04241 [Verruconis gallopava]|uniref:Rhodopsin domain-containing protein n=1 Tax=Verruconis gallopava TaxID=253628 RepID=A0A0D1YV12_9PEZI|nr:uncharacterized protein PV09_04241 [Verruconis gallopava]KIW04482.1 hypothetical protein PV09_04241 [Verruconis gallopava]